MRVAPIIAVLLAASPMPALAAPNVFWTFGFDFRQSDARAPRFGAIAPSQDYAMVSAPRFADAVIPAALTGLCDTSRYGCDLAGPAAGVTPAFVALEKSRKLADAGFDRSSASWDGAPSRPHAQ